MLLEQCCPVCDSPKLEAFFEMTEVPVFCNLLWPDQQAAKSCPKGDIQLAFCPACGFIGNVAFDLARLKYSQAYENSLDFSPRFQKYAQSLATALVEDLHLYDKTIVEIGCGKGDFLALLCRLGHNRGIGFDPTYIPLPEHQVLGKQFQVIQDFYSERYGNYQADFFCCRHTLEHIPTPIGLLQTLRKSMGDRDQTLVFLEVPNALDTFCHLAIWDIIYEHCCYFAPVTLAYALAASGFQVQGLAEAYQGQFLTITATPSHPQPDFTEQHRIAVQELADEIAAFPIKFQHKVKTWQEQLNQFLARGKRLVIWGAGSKGVTFSNLLQTQDQIEYMVDVNPRKHGMYAAGTGQQIIPPELLQEYQPDLILVMNSIYESEIYQMLQSMDLDAETLCV
ncbi:MAG: methyltransferase domain-containing protein [Leptolyngbyaceae bacterium]|nr:methyltransferase domain-containing protein [Leptolyngbyaceae bacterium]